MGTVRKNGHTKRAMLTEMLLLDALDLAERSLSAGGDAMTMLEKAMATLLAGLAKAGGATESVTVTETEKETDDGIAITRLKRTQSGWTPSLSKKRRRQGTRRKISSAGRSRCVPRTQLQRRKRRSQRQKRPRLLNLQFR
jgi:hypothetical protein